MRGFHSLLSLQLPRHFYNAVVQLKQLNNCVRLNDGFSIEQEKSDGNCLG